jgi:hypothetical protein
MYAGLREQRRWVLPEVLAEQAATHPGKPWIGMTDGTTLTFGEAHEESALIGHWGDPSGKPMSEDELERLLTLAEEDPEAMTDEEVVALLAALYAAYPWAVKAALDPD